MFDISRLITDFQHHKNNFEEIYIHYKTVIFSLAKKYFIFEYINDISSKLWSIVSILNTSTFKNNIEIDKYIFHSLKNFCIDIYRNIKPKKDFIIYNSKIIDTNLNNELYSESIDDSLLNFYSIIHNLPERQRKIIDLKYHYCFSDIEISKELSISRQAVNKNINLALNKLRTNLLN
ncbi:MAG: sigma-70 family RNA polymerase sigma factor [Paeniclostridium sp.]|nr:sigma-70 family RNA polymerase sigma factor [Paeniclostridium sp.]MBW4862287.1 sigma-70 family RNA polymerase sigma factor [Paeniclostridium sp.]MBW4875195.1 sigma-70 family RNA polymerase sigma factor [Paeniclostridium sp.]